jgi:hypothetical protein
MHHHVLGKEMHHHRHHHHHHTGGKKSIKKSTSSKKSMRGGMESSGATPLPMRFYNPETPLDNYPELSGNGSMSAYGPIESGDIGTGMLAPYTASTCQTANPSSGMKTGGSKKNKKSLIGGGLIPKISASPVTTVQNGINGAIDQLSSFMAKLDANYLKSVEYVKSIKIGRTPVQSAIQGILKTLSTVPYDNLFHVFMIFKTSKGEILFEKNARINASTTIPKSEDWYDINSVPNRTLNDYIQTAKKAMGNRFFSLSSKY